MTLQQDQLLLQDLVLLPLLPTLKIQPTPIDPHLLEESPPLPEQAIESILKPLDRI